MGKWLTLELGKLIVEVSDGGTPSRSNPDNFGGKIPWIVISDISDSITKTKETLTKEGLNNCTSKLWEPDTVILSIGATIGEVGITTIGAATKQGICGIVVDRSQITSQYLKYWLQLNKPILLNLAQGSTIKEIRPKLIKKLSINLPDNLETQEAIVEILTKADEAIQQTERLIAKYEAIRTGLMQDLLTRGIDEAGNVRSEETHAFKDSELGRIPVEWEVESLKNLAQIIDPQPDHRTPPADPDGFPYVGIGDITEDGRIDKKCRRIIRAALSKQQSRFTIDTGDIIFGKIGTIGKPQSINETKDIALSANIILIKPLRNNQLVLEILKSDFTRRQIKNTIHTTTQPAFGMGKTRALQFAWPNLPKERNQIELTLTQNSKILQEANMQLEKLTALKTALMQDLLTGNKRVDDLLD
jgi:type I restriction enzyme S subunit